MSTSTGLCFPQEFLKTETLPESTAFEQENRYTEVVPQEARRTGVVDGQLQLLETQTGQVVFGHVFFKQGQGALHHTAVVGGGDV